MRFLRNYKYHFLACAAIVLLFAGSLFVRNDHLSIPLAHPREWITAHTLITCEIWSRNGGPAAYHFSPVYTYPGEGNHRRTMLGGVVDAKGDVYYVSYPPFAFIFAYYALEIMGGPEPGAIRHLILGIHLLCALLIYFIAVSLAAEGCRRNLSVAGLAGAFLYLFSCGNLWFHGNLYFADMLVQPLLLSILLTIVRFVRGLYRNENRAIIALGILFFLATYTEWMGLFMAAVTGLSFFVYWLFRRNKKWLKAFLVTGFSASLALGLTVLQYSSIAGWDKLKEVSTKKYNERSGQLGQAETPNAFTIDNGASYEFMIDKIDLHYKMAENFAGVFAILLLVIVLIPNARRRIEYAGTALGMIGLLATAILIHYYLFFNFNALHEFSSLKTGTLFMLAALVCIALIESAVSLNWRIVLFLLVGYLAVDKGMESVQCYNGEFLLTEVDYPRISTGEAIRNYGRKDAAVFVNIFPNPELVYHADHNVFPIYDTAQLVHFMNFFENDEGQYYHHRDKLPEYILEFRRENGKLVFLNKIQLHAETDAAERSHMK
jgi:hypothetical protein